MNTAGEMADGADVAPEAPRLIGHQDALIRQLQCPLLGGYSTESTPCTYWRCAPPGASAASAAGSTRAPEREPYIDRDPTTTHVQPKRKTLATTSKRELRPLPIVASRDRPGPTVEKVPRGLLRPGNAGSDAAPAMSKYWTWHWMHTEECASADRGVAAERLTSPHSDATMI